MGRELSCICSNKVGFLVLFCSFTQILQLLRSLSVLSDNKLKYTFPCWNCVTTSLALFRRSLSGLKISPACKMFCKRLSVQELCVTEVSWHIFVVEIMLRIWRISQGMFRGYLFWISLHPKHSRACMYLYSFSLEIIVSVPLKPFLAFTIMILSFTTLHMRYH